MDRTKSNLLGAIPQGDGTTSFLLWAPFAKKVELKLEDKMKGKRKQSRNEMEALERGYFSTTIEAHEGARYFYVLDGSKLRPDPASRFQPDGVHKESEIVDPNSFKWTDNSWKGIGLDELIIYELHIGTFTRRGTFDSARKNLGYLKNELGVTAIEIMPVNQFPGERNWGYDGVDLFAPQNSYGGPQGLKSLIDNCHSFGLAVILDVVYNHLGPEGNYLGDFGPYFSRKYTTPWGSAVNYDEAGSDEVKRFVVENATYWIREFHVDGLRLDAIDKIFDSSPKNILLKISESVHNEGKKIGRKVNVIAESDLNDPRTIRKKNSCGFGMDAQWSDDFHHSVHSLLTGEKYGFYSDYGIVDDVATSLLHGFVYVGKYSIFRKRSQGAPTGKLPGDKFVFFIQNHDQVGNRPDGRRIATLVEPAKALLASALSLLSQSIPLLFMGEEYGERNPFFYFTSHSDQDLVKAVREGRKREFARHKWRTGYLDPMALSTYNRSKIDLEKIRRPLNRIFLDFYSQLLGIRKSLPAFKDYGRDSAGLKLLKDQNVLILNRENQKNTVISIFVLGDKGVTISKSETGLDSGNWEKVLDSQKFLRKDTNRTEIDDQLWKKRVADTFLPYSVIVFSRNGSIKDQ